MPPVSVRYHLFKVSVSDGGAAFEDLIDEIDGLDLVDRGRTVGGATVRLEKIVRRGGNYLLNFVKLREGHGPGRASDDAEIEGFELADDEHFGEDTAALYIPANGYMIVQYNHWGVRPSGIESYCSGFEGDETSIYTLNAKLDASAERRFRDQDYVRRIEVGIDVNRMSARDLADGSSLAQMAAIAANMGADKIYITMSISTHDPARRLAAGAKALVRRALRLPGEAQARVISRGKQTADAPIETVDLLEEKLEHLARMNLGPDKRLDFDDRARVLTGLVRTWQTHM